MNKEIILKYLRLNQKIDNLSRKIIHALSGLAIFFFPYVFTVKQIVFLSVLFALIFTLARIFNFLGVINKVKRLSWGEVFYPLGVLISALVFLPNNILAFQFGVLVLGFSDALANVIGSLFGEHKIKVYSGAKSCEGSLAFFLSIFLLLILFNIGSSNFNLASYSLVALSLTTLEFVMFFGLDNLFLPVVAGYLFTLIA